MEQNKSDVLQILTKHDIMNIYQCANDKALRILRVLFQMGYGIKLGKQYYITKENFEKFTKEMSGREIVI